MALKFAAFTLAKAQEKGVDATLKLEIPFSEEKVLQEQQTYLFENMPTITTIKVYNVEDAAGDAEFPNAKQSKEKATPGQPVAYFC